MTELRDGLYNGTVVHKRLQPRPHTLRYSVFTCLFDVSRIDDLDKKLRLFSRNRFNLLSLYDRDHAEGDLEKDLRKIATRSGCDRPVARFMMLCYPRVFGYAFNPLTVYFGLDADDRVCLTIYEVRNTFGGRTTYVLNAAPDADGLVHQHCRKRFYVSPFNSVEGDYHFHVTRPAEQLTVGVALKTAGRAVADGAFPRRARTADRRASAEIGRRHRMDDRQGRHRDLL